MIRIALVDDHKLFRQGMHHMIGSFAGMEVVLEAGNGQELLDLLPGKAVDIVLLDLEMPEMDGIKATPLLKKAFPDLKVVILSMHDDEQMIAHLMELGANGYLLKDADPEEVEMAIQTTHHNAFYFNDRVSKAMLSGLVDKQTISPVFNPVTPLSERELEVLELICHELTSQEIADKLFLSKRTIEGHRNHLLEKIGARNTAGLVIFAAKNGLLK